MFVPAESRCSMVRTASCGGRRKWRMSLHRRWTCPPTTREVPAPGRRSEAGSDETRAHLARSSAAAVTL